ncbi:MAG: hypothetical protein K6G52_01490, partial [Treponemataceae bacterium]|nr:hypothetical protein [Treponemataceae bacterium]
RLRPRGLETKRTVRENASSAERYSMRRMDAPKVRAGGLKGANTKFASGKQALAGELKKT